jgi:2-polyprenyl-3-methyl-5-hydroxy-6-metoxy-1,4-benzoquinol methylase
MTEANDLRTPPSMADQMAYWNDWNMRWRDHTQSFDFYQRRQLITALNLLPRPSKTKVLEIGCGTGWLSASLAGFVSVTGFDLSDVAIEEAKRRGSRATFFQGDVHSVALIEKFEAIVTVDTMAHVPDHAAFIKRVAELLQPKGRLILMTQNPFVWRRSSTLLPQAKGQIRNWPELSALRELLKDRFKIKQVTSIVPAGDQKILRVLQSRYCAGVLRMIIGEKLQERLFERLMIGKEIIIVADLK